MVLVATIPQTERPKIDDANNFEAWEAREYREGSLGSVCYRKGTEQRLVVSDLKGGHAKSRLRSFLSRGHREVEFHSEFSYDSCGSGFSRRRD